MNSLILAVINGAYTCNQDLCLCRPNRAYCYGYNKNQTDPRDFINRYFAVSYSSIFISGKNFTYLPSRMFEFLHIQTLDLTWNEISFIENDTFSGIDGLEELLLMRNKIKTIDIIIASLTDSSSTLRRLNLFVNLIETINTRIPSSFNKLISLYLNGNPINNITNNVFKNLTKYFFSFQ